MLINLEYKRMSAENVKIAKKNEKNVDLHFKKTFID